MRTIAQALCVFSVCVCVYVFVREGGACVCLQVQEGVAHAMGTGKLMRAITQAL
jgi:hypothetical protein